ncbi:MAG: hypothetical protein V2I35_00745 [Desulfocapsaceae bacterium]|nr:hypothetical protein [Desulfocapsaceae bacterium]
MHKQSKSKYNAHLIRLTFALVVVIVLGLAARQLFTPESMGEYGHYRGADIADQKVLPVRLGTNDACFECHQPIRSIHKQGVHKTVSCEVCHGLYGDHISDGKKIASLPIVRGDDVVDLCLRCHNKIITARPRTEIKVIGMPEHLQDKHVQLTHTCDQCHMVHDPLLWINQAKEIVGVATIKPLKQSGPEKSQ